MDAHSGLQELSFRLQLHSHIYFSKMHLSIEQMLFCVKHAQGIPLSQPAAEALV